MPATVRASSSAAVDTGTITVTKPSGTLDGDLLLAVCFADPDGAAVTAPAGWTLVGTTFTAASVGFGRVYRKAASGEPASYAFTGSGSSSNAVLLLAVTGHDPASPVDVAATWGSGAASTSHVAPSVSPAGVDSLLVCGWYALTSSSAVTYTPPADMTERADLQPPGRWIASSLATVGLSASGATGTRTATCSQSQPFIGVSLAVRSASSGGGQSVAPAGVSVPAAVGSPSSTWSGATGPDGLGVAVTSGSPVASWSAGVGPDGLAVPVAVGAPAAGSAGAVPDGVPVPVAVGAPGAAWSGSVSPDGVLVLASVGAPSVGAAGLVPDGLEVPIATGAVDASWSVSVAADGVVVPVLLGAPGVWVAGQHVARPDAGTVTRPVSGTVVRPDAGVVARP